MKISIVPSFLTWKVATQIAVLENSPLGKRVDMLMHKP